jgi:L-aspartate oxidase
MEGEGRYLSAMPDRIRTRFLVVGSGVAGLHTAWRAATDGDVTVLTKRSLFDSATAYAQGGIAAALGAGDSPELHRRDTLAAGAALCDADAVEVLVEEGPARVRELATAGAHFDLDPSGKLKLGREAAHSRRRIVHAHGDQTGAEVARTLIARVRETPNVHVSEKTRVLDLIVENGECVGVRATVAGQATDFIADVTVLATGGCGQVYRYTTNPVVATGDGYAIAHRAGAKLADMEFVQFHPTALDVGRDPMPLVSEAVRGEGAVLVDETGERFTDELEPRDQVSRAVWRHQAKGHRVFLDARAALGERFAARFPAIAARCRAAGLDPARAAIPVRPAAHYHMGGIAVDAAGRSSIAGLWACGEAAATGLHGANRLASNSLLEAAACARWVAESVAGTSAHRLPLPPAPALPPAAAAGPVREIMSSGLGVLRDRTGLNQAIAALGTLAFGDGAAADPAAVGVVIARAALAREESRGAHWRNDFPFRSSAPPRRSMLRLSDAARVPVEAAGG